MQPLFALRCQATVQKAIDVSQKAHRAWERRSLEERASIFLKAADLLCGKYRMDVMATTMLGQVRFKTLFRAKIFIFVFACAFTWSSCSLSL